MSKTFADFAAGSRRLGPVAAALVATACLASTATFAINPGFVFAEGLAAFIGFSIPVALGVGAALTTLGPRFRETSIGPDGTARALTLPQWIGERFDSPALRKLFSILLLALFSYVVLVLVGAAYVAAALLGVSVPVAGAVVLAAVLVNLLRGGANAHALLNVAQGGLLVAAAGMLGAVALTRLLGDGSGALAAAARADVHYLALTRPGSSLFANLADVLVFPFVVGYALGCQPHILAKTLHLDGERAARRFAYATAGLFLALSLGALSVGFAARADLAAGIPQDRIASAWVAQTLPGPLAAVIGLALVLAGTSTLEGLLLALAGTLAHDVAGRSSVRAVRIATVAIGLLALAVAANPPRLVWITGALGAYALVAAACPAVVAGCLERGRPSARWVAAAAIGGPAVHIALWLSGISSNPNATGTAGILAGLVLVALGRKPSKETADVAHRERLAGALGAR